MFVSACVYVYTSVSICDSMHVYIFHLGCFQVSYTFYMHTHACVCMCVCVCVCVCVQDMSL